MELLYTILNHNGTVVLANNERLTIPPTLRFIWEMESLEAMSPSMLASVGVLVMSENDVGWKLLVVQWLEHRNEADRDLLTSFCDTYIERIVDYINACTLPAIFGDKQSGNGYPKYTRCLNPSVVNMLHTFISLFEALVSSFTDLTDVEYERYFSYAAVWAFGGTLDVEHRESFSNWWRTQFDQHIDYPEDGTVFDYVVDNETHNFCKWSDLVPSYTGTPHQGIPQDAFVHTVQNEQLLHLLGVLTDAGRHVMLVGENGCGKTAIVNERIRTVCSGEVAEVLSLVVYANRFTNSRLLFDRLDERLEWKHGRTHVPKGNKRLLCLVDDINLSQVDQFGHQTACELVREHLDDGGIYSPATHAWRYVKNVTYVTTLNPHTTADTPKPSQRLLRHFCHLRLSLPGAQSRIQGEETLRRVIGSMACVTVELHNRLRTMFLPTAQRCHYIFTARDLANIFRNICLSLQPACEKSSLLLLWQHECYWVYGRRMVSEVDIRRFRQAFITAVRKQFIDDDQDSGIVTAGMIDTRSSANVTEEDARTDLYRPAKSLKDVTDLLEKGVEEYNKIHPRIKLALYKGEKLALLIHEEELVTDDLLVYLTDFIVSCSITPLFTHEEQTTIITPSEPRTVRNNCRVCLVISSTDSKFPASVSPAEIENTHMAVTKTLEQIRYENEMAIKLKKQLEQRDGRPGGTQSCKLEDFLQLVPVKILSQIGQDTAITEQQIRVVKNQLEKIERLKKVSGLLFF
nr:hypothetical protein BaRGS_025624 [Batillaria attramentaria]